MAFKPSEDIAVLATIDPDAYATGAQTSDWASFEYFEAMLAVVQAGTLGASATLNAKFQEATSATGAGAQDITGKAITALTQAGSDADKQALINLRADELSDGFTHAAVVMTVGTAASDAGVVVLGVKPKHGPANGHDLSTVDEIVA